MASKATKTKSRRRSYTPEFKAEAVRLVLDGSLKQAQVSRDLDIPESVLGRWVQAARAKPDGGSLSDAERLELAELRREVRVLRRERDILKKAAAFFAKETL
jgi:transposase